ncbi:MAG TPA: RNA methyltransferase [Acidimicrobiales bacterium]|nr:RNA methyltransferase [Acidimicrobiales bacterium]
MIERVADTVTPQPLLSVVGMVDVALAEVVGLPLTLVLVDVRDPGNVGAILRSADAAGVSAVIGAAGSGDCYNPKAVRASAGSIFHLPIVWGTPAGELLDALQAAGVSCVATAATGGTDYAAATLEGPLALLLGNEANGLDPQLAARCDQAVTVPIAGGAESLNVAMAATVLCFELARRRRGGDAPGFSMSP